MNYNVDVEKKSVEASLVEVQSSAILQHAPEGLQRESSRDVEIPAVPLSASLRASLALSLDALRALKSEILEKIEFAWSREAELENRIEQLMRSAGSVDENRKKVMGESVAMYTSLLRGVIVEIDEELVFFSPFTQEEHPFVVKVPFGASHQSSTVFFENSVKLLKSQSKNIRKYLAVSYSRYIYGFDLQERNIDRLEYKVAAIIEQQHQR